MAPFHYAFAFIVYFSSLVVGSSLVGIRMEQEANCRMDDGILRLTASKPVSLRVFGDGLVDGAKIAFTTQTPKNESTDCADLQHSESLTLVIDEDGRSATFTAALRQLTGEEECFYICLRDPGLFGWIHQGMAKPLRIITEPPVPPSVHTYFLPFGVQVCIVIFLLSLSGLFSGLNLGLMSLDNTELRMIERCGSESERRYAKTIRPLRKRGNFLLCTLLLGNVLVNNTMTILLDDLTSGLVAVIGATLAIVVFGEILPQSVCSRHGLAIGARTAWLTKFFMVLTFPLAFPISKILDWVLGDEMGQVYNREKLTELVRTATHELQKDEIDIIAGALEFSKKTVAAIMTPLSDVYMLDIHRVLDFETMSEIMKMGYSRIPVYEGDKKNVVSLLNIKDLAFVDPDDNTPLQTVCKFYNHPVTFVFEDIKLDAMLREFKKGQSHMAFVLQVKNEEEGDPYYEPLGLVTLEDVIEEILQSEIMDETDVITDNRVKKPRRLMKTDFSVFNEPDENSSKISPQLTLAAFQFLSTAVEPFRPDWLADSILQKLLKKDIVVDLKYDKHGSNLIFEKDKPCDYFVLILQGRVQADVGKENLVFESGPFTYFGVQALQSLPGTLALSHTSLNSLTSLQSNLYGRQTTYLPDYTVRAVTDVQYMKIHRGHYVAARQATIVHRHSKQRTQSATTDSADDAFTKEWIKLKLSHKNHECGAQTPSMHCDTPSPMDAGRGLVEDDPLLEADRTSLDSVTVMLNGQDNGPTVPQHSSGRV